MLCTGLLLFKKLAWLFRNNFNCKTRRKDYRKQKRFPLKYSSHNIYIVTSIYLRILSGFVIK